MGGVKGQAHAEPMNLAPHETFIPPQVPLAEIGGACGGILCGVSFRLVPSEIRGQAPCGRKELAGSQAMTGEAYRPDSWAAGVACDSNKRQGLYFRARENLLSGFGVSSAGWGCKASLLS